MAVQLFYRLILKPIVIEIDSNIVLDKSGNVKVEKNTAVFVTLEFKGCQEPTPLDKRLETEKWKENGQRVLFTTGRYKYLKKNKKIKFSCSPKSNKQTNQTKFPYFPSPLHSYKYNYNN